MTIRKRLVISNILMIAVPVFITAMIALVCLASVWAVVHHGNGIGFDDSNDFFSAGRSMMLLIEEALEGSPTDRYSHLEALGGTLDQSSMSLVVLSDSGRIYSYGEEQSVDNALISAVDSMGGDGTATSGGRSIYAQKLTVSDTPFQVYIFCNESELSYSSLKTAIALVAIILGFTVLVSILLTNRFLTRFIFRRIEEPLEILSAGAKEIGDGNLDYRIDYKGEDEFSAVCSEFDGMAFRLKESVEERRRHEESHKELMAGISHDLRSPLTSIQAYVEGLQDGIASTPEKQKLYLETIRQKTGELQYLVSQLFLFSKLDLDDFPLHMKKFRLDEFMISMFLSLGTEYEKQQLILSVKETVPAMVYADPDLLRRVVANVISNSARYRCSEIGHLRADMHLGKGNVLLCLSDDGPGVPEEALSRLFDAFYRNDPARHAPEQGSGLGLAIAARAVRRMGGSISAANIEPHGLLIEISLPCVNMEV